MKRIFKRKIVTRENASTLFTLPTTILMLFVVIYAAAWTFWMALHRWTAGVMREPEFIGLGNLIRMINDSRLMGALARTAYYSGLGTIIQVTLGTLIALALVKYIKSERIRMVLLTLYLIPMMLSEAIVAHVWHMLATPEGALNCVLRGLGLPGIGWLSCDLVLTTMMIADTWQWTSLPLLLAYAGRVSIPKELYEMAALDGASDWMILRRVTLPHLKKPLMIAALLRFMDSYKYVDKVLLITYGGPGYASETLGMYTFQVSFGYRYVGYAAALCWMTGLIALVLVYLFWRIARR